MFDPATKPGAGARPGRVTHCCFEHAGQNFGSLDRGPRAIRLKCRYGWRTSELKSKSSRKRNPVDPVAEEIPDAEHELVIERVAAIDVAKASGTVCVRLAGKSGRRVSRVWDVQAVTGAVAGLAEQLTEVGVQKVTVESTSDYWRIWYYLLEAAGLDVQLVNARDVKNVPGRPKTDKLDAVWLAKLTEKGLLRPSFVPPAPIRQLRDYTRLRVDLTRERTRYWQRLEKLLEDALIKISAVASTLDTLSTRDMIEALIAGERDPRRLADLARGKMKAKRSALITALDGRFDDHHGELARMLLDQIDTLTAQIAALTRRIEQLLAAMPDTRSRGDGGTGGDRDRRRTGHGVERETAARHRRHAADPGRAARRDHRHRRAQRADHPGRDRPGHDPVPHACAPGVVGQTVPAHHSVRAGDPRRQDRQGQPLSERRARRGRRRSRHAPTPSSANATAVSSSAAANSRPWSRSPARSWSSSGTCSPIRQPASATSAPTTTPTHPSPNEGCATTSPNSPPWATGSPSNPPPRPPNTQSRNHTRLPSSAGSLRLPTHPEIIFRSDRDNLAMSTPSRNVSGSAITYSTPIPCGTAEL